MRDFRLEEKAARIVFEQCPRDYALLICVDTRQLQVVKALCDILDNSRLGYFPDVADRVRIEELELGQASGIPQDIFTIILPQDEFDRSVLVGKLGEWVLEYDYQLIKGDS
mgnify:CR=1 FL=1